MKAIELNAQASAPIPTRVKVFMGNFRLAKLAIKLKTIEERTIAMVGFTIGYVVRGVVKAGTFWRGITSQLKDAATRPIPSNIAGFL